MFEDLESPSTPVPNQLLDRSYKDPVCALKVDLGFGSKVGKEGEDRRRSVDRGALNFELLKEERSFDEGERDGSEEA